MQVGSRLFSRGVSSRLDDDVKWKFKDTIKRLIPFIHPFRRKHFQGFLCIVATNIFAVFSPLVLKYSIEDLESGVTADKIFLYSMMIIMLAIMAGIFRYFMRRIIISTSRRIEYNIRVAYYEHLQRLSPSFFDKQQTGDLMTRATSDIEAIRMIVGPAIMYSTDTLLTFCFALSLMTAISIPLTLTVLAFAPIISTLIYFLAKRIHLYSLNAQENYSNLNAMTQEHLTGIRVVRSYCQEEHENRLFNKLNRKYFYSNMKLAKIQAAMFPLFYSIFGIGMALILYIGGKAIISGTMTLGDFVAFSAYVAMLAWPVIAIGWVLNIYQRGSASMQRVSRILDTPPEIKETFVDKSIHNLKGDIEFDDLSFSYQNSDNIVLKNINLSVPAGTSLGIVGKVGSGKSSLVSLIPRLYCHTGGKLTIDGEAIENISLNLLRSNIAFVPQDNFLFSDKLKENVLFNNPDLGDERLHVVSDLSKLSADVEAFPDGFDTWVGERGITLSGGQKQRACLARALAADPEILIMDDCFSSVDTNTEADILENLLPIIRGKTVLIVAHRISTLQWADQIIVLHEGEIVERGCHQELLDIKGIYAELHRKQLLEKELKSGI